MGRLVEQFGKSQVQCLDKIPKGWKLIKGALTAPVGYEWISNGKSIFSEDYKTALVKEVPKESRGGAGSAGGRTT